MSDKNLSLFLDEIDMTSRVHEHLIPSKLKTGKDKRLPGFNKLILIYIYVEERGE
jgi:hypothetical protein